MLDTRDGTGGRSGALQAGESTHLQLEFNGVPPGVAAVVLNVTVTGTTAPSYLTVHPSDVGRPVVSNLNYLAGATVANQVIVRLGGGGVEIFNAAGRAHVIVDLVGFYRGFPALEEGRFIPVEPFRAIDTRDDSPFDPPGIVPPGGILFYGDPDETATAYAMNVTATGANRVGYVTGYPFSPSYPGPPLTSTVNYAPRRTVPNHAIISTGPYVGFYNSGGHVHLIVDVFGYFT